MLNMYWGKVIQSTRLIVGGGGGGVIGIVGYSVMFAQCSDIKNWHKVFFIILCDRAFMSLKHHCEPSFIWTSTGVCDQVRDFIL